MESWNEAKLFIEHSLPIEHGTLHVVVGVLAWLVLGRLGRRPLASWLPWLGVLGLEAWNEFVDLWVERWPHPGMQLGEGAHDLILTMLLPTVLLFAIRHQPQLFLAQGSAAPVGQAAVDQAAPS